MTALGDFFPRRINSHVPEMSYAADVRKDGVGRVDLGVLAASSATAIAAAQSIATAGVAYPDPVAQSEALMGKFGRNVVVAASGAATSNVTVRGRDYLGQPMVESFTLNGTTPVVGKKAFRWVESITFGATAATTVDVGVGNVLGVPYAIQAALAYFVDEAALTTNQGTVVQKLADGTTQSATTGDPRGTYAPHTSNVPNGAKKIELLAAFAQHNLHGDAHFYS